MRKFKLFFYPIYLIIAVLVLYYSIDILANMDAYKERVDFTMLRKLPQYILYLLLVVSLLMITEFGAENFHLIKLKRKLRQAEKDLLSIKAKLYDRTQPEEPEEEESDEDEEDGEDDEEDTDDYKLN